MLAGLCRQVEQQAVPMAKEGLAGLAVLAQVTHLFLFIFSN